MLMPNTTQNGAGLGTVLERFLAIVVVNYKSIGTIAS